MASDQQQRVQHLEHFLGRAHSDGLLIHHSMSAIIGVARHFVSRALIKTGMGGSAPCTLTN